jgi:hypothetical protein
MPIADISTAMHVIRYFMLTLCLLASPAYAQDAPADTPLIPDVVYKGLVGKALDAVPMDAERRVALQRANAVVSSTVTGRSLTVWAGLANPVLMIAGMAWGIYSASNIRTDEIKLDMALMGVEQIDLFEDEPIPVAQFFGSVAERDAYESAIVALVR